ncbi:MAG: SDR family NAD(P)-dependent oxidoreductase [Burkholderiales bacterium]|nr:SDR family NAD(P)-dependent oxidoreductase [Burkholderiales bacterium]
MSGMLAGKVAVVTGAGGGIGRGIALAMAAAGAKVVVNDIGASLAGEGTGAGPAQQVADEIIKAGGQAVPNTDSVATRVTANNIIETAVQTFGRIDIVVNNAGNLRDRVFHKMSEEEWTQVIDVHLNGTFYVSRAAANYYREQESGAFVHMTSTSGLIGNFGQANYSAAKLGIASSIPANTDEEKARVTKLQKMEANKIAPMAVYLGSDRASEVTGQIFGVRANEIMLFSQPRPIRSVHMSTGWTPEAIAEIAAPAMKHHFMALERSPDAIDWDPI